jgi:hypothetical protein
MKSLEEVTRWDRRSGEVDEVIVTHSSLTPENGDKAVFEEGGGDSVTKSVNRRLSRLYIPGAEATKPSIPSFSSPSPPSSSSSPISSHSSSSFSSSSFTSSSPSLSASLLQAQPPVSPPLSPNTLLDSSLTRRPSLPNSLSPSAPLVKMPQSSPSLAPPPSTFHLASLSPSLQSEDTRRSMWGSPPEGKAADQEEYPLSKKREDKRKEKREESGKRSRNTESIDTNSSETALILSSAISVAEGNSPLTSRSIVREKQKRRNGSKILQVSRPSLPPLLRVDSSPAGGLLPFFHQENDNESDDDLKIEEEEEKTERDFIEKDKQSVRFSPLTPSKVWYFP